MPHNWNGPIVCPCSTSIRRTRAPCCGICQARLTQSEGSECLSFLSSYGDCQYQVWFYVSLPKLDQTHTRIDDLVVGCTCYTATSNSCFATCLYELLPGLRFCHVRCVDHWISSLYIGQPLTPCSLFLEKCDSPSASGMDSTCEILFIRRARHLYGYSK